jgi:hypothetical protein
MTDCLNKNITVNQPTYCEDGDPSTVMYNWMHVRAVGPNCLKDTRLCGTTIIDGNETEICPQSKFGSCWLFGAPIFENPVTDNAYRRQAQGVIGLGSTNPPYNWTVYSEFTQDIPSPFLAYIPSATFRGIIGMSNIHPERILVRATLTASIYVDYPVLVPTIVNIILGKPSNPPISAPLDSERTCTVSFPVSVAPSSQIVSITCIGHFQLEPSALTTTGAVIPYWNTNAGEQPGPTTVSLVWTRCCLQLEVLRCGNTTYNPTITNPPPPQS